MSVAGDLEAALELSPEALKEVRTAANAFRTFSEQLRHAESVDQLAIAARYIHSMAEGLLKFSDELSRSQAEEFMHSVGLKKKH